MYVAYAYYDLLLFCTNSLPNDIAQIQVNKAQSQRDIKIRIENLCGINSMVCAPFKAFESSAREQILQFKEPVLACVELVIKELSNAVRVVLSGRVCTINLLNYKLRIEFKLFNELRH